ncbi:MAG: nitroreductase family protein [Bacteroidaceae bacterium]|nr:nitroreductase family protein [Bacteroidaceae bacterium]
MSACIDDFFKRRRSFYRLNREISVCDEDIEKAVRFTVMHTPSAFNSQSSRLVLLLGESHERFWNIVCEKISKIISHAAFEKSRKKIETSFANGYGTVLFFEDNLVIEELKKSNPLYASSFPVYSQHTSAMHQLTLWLLLSDINLGASLQHYGELVEEDVIKSFSLPQSWHLVAEMPFGNPLDIPAEKSIIPIEERIKIFR